MGSKAPNKWKLYNMAGNLYEWIHDLYQANIGTTAITDPAGPATGTYRVVRGGAFHQEAERTRAAWRQGELPKSRMAAIGIRCARSL